MDYKAFFADVLDWIQQANQTAGRHGLSSEAFWKWASDSTVLMERKYQAHPLVVKQMVMLIEWIEESRRRP